jgi:nitroimidazol reductase NimA-like FMN-containing flavoprotein (pyridoxamine 5'-phosphate oxidase superfamily)
VRLQKRHATFLERARVVRIATTGPDGTPHVVPVCAVLANGRLFFGSGDDARKVRNLEAKPRATAVADDYSEAWDGLRGVMVTGDAVIHRRGPRFRSARRLLYAKYPQYKGDAALDEGDSVIVELRPTHVFAWGF